MLDLRSIHVTDTSSKFYTEILNKPVVSGVKLMGQVVMYDNPNNPFALDRCY